ncbi:MAG: hypothetical protein Q8Q94_04110 [bacterium]|nr:hypothetical protein [bacterium]MDZ4299473.1 hypothetical protein [Candidatus Sungbacteria bacterium]
MQITRSKNTKDKGVVEYLIYKEKDKFIGVCLTFDIIEEGDNREKVMQDIFDAAQVHLQTVIRHNLPDELLNRYAPQKYWKKYFDFQQEIKKHHIEKMVADAIQRVYNRKSLNSVHAKTIA